jgi:hypothetical protein
MRSDVMYKQEFSVFFLDIFVFLLSSDKRGEKEVEEDKMAS